MTVSQLSRRSIVYLAANLINGKRYVGATSYSLKVRRYKHEWQATKGKKFHCRAFHAAIKKYGTGSFEWMVLASCESFEVSMREEMRLISEIRPEYNLTAGGNGTIGFRQSAESIEKRVSQMRGRKHSPEHIRKCSEARKGRVFSPETRAKLRAQKIGKKLSPDHIAKVRAGRAGWRPSAEHRLRISESQIGRKMSAESVAKRWVTRRAKQAQNRGVAP